MKQFFLSLLLALGLINPTPTVSQPQLEIGNTVIKIEIADTDLARAQGLSGRSSLPTDSGLLFIFSTPGKPGFWMKDMHFPIDIIWLDEDWRVAAITANLAPETYPQVFYPPTPIKYVLEVNAGLAEKNQLKIGNRAKQNSAVASLQTAE